VSSGGTFEWLGSSKDTTGMTFSRGAVLEVGSGYVTAADVSAGITEKVLASGVQSGGAILSGGVVDVLAGGIVTGMVVSSGGKLFVFSGGTDIDPTISSGGSGIVSAGGLILAQSGGTAEIDGFLVNSGALFASGSDSLVEIASGSVVSGGSAVVGDGVVEIAASSSENVAFVSDGNGGLILDDALAGNYKGRVFGFGGVSGSNSVQFIAFTEIGSGATVSYKPAAGNTSGTLTVASGGVSATVTLVGHYTSASFVSSTVGGHVEITDPSAVPAHAGIAFGAATTLAYSDNGKIGLALTAAEGPHAHCASRQLHGGNFRDHGGRERRHGHRRNAAYI
jgi:autotransporter passenger strand-loop-strand repeat protein